MKYLHIIEKIMFIFTFSGMGIAMYSLAYHVFTGGLIK